jgi:hypothetical protein
MSPIKSWGQFNQDMTVNMFSIYEERSVNVVDQEVKKKEQEVKDAIKKDLERMGVSVEQVDIVFSQDGVSVVGPTGEIFPGIPENPSYGSGGYTPGSTSAHSADRDSYKTFSDLAASAADTAKRGYKSDRGDLFSYGSKRSEEETDREYFNRYLFGSPGSSTSTIGSGVSNTAYSGASLNSGISQSNQKKMQDKREEENRKIDPKLGDKTSAMSEPNYSAMGKPSFVGSRDYDNIVSKIGDTRKSALNFLEDVGFDAGSIPRKENTIVAVRVPLEIKNKYPNDFTDFLILFKKDGDIDVILGSTTPSPAFRYKKWYDYYIGIGFLKLAQQGGSYILNPGTYTFKISDGGNKRDFFGTQILEQDGGVDVDIYPVEDDLNSVKRTESFEPGQSYSGNIGLCLTPALPDGKNASALDATTSGDQVVKDPKEYEKIINAAKGNASGKIDYFLVEANITKSKRDIRKEEKEEKRRERKMAKMKDSEDNLRESSMYHLKYIKKFGF